MTNPSLYFDFVEKTTAVGQDKIPEPSSHYFSQTRACHGHGLCHTGGPGLSLNLVRSDNLRPRNLYRILVYCFGKFQGIKRLGSML